MAQPKLSEVTLPDGTKAYVMSQEQMAALAEIAENHIWLKQTEIRVKRVSLIAGVGIGALMFIASSWPQLTQIVRFFFPEAPK